MRRLLLVLVLALAGCHHDETPVASNVSRDAYIGSAACKDCHEKNYIAWTHDWHARALSKATPRDMVARFDNAHFRGDSTEAWMERRGDRYLMRTRDKDGNLGDYDVAWVIGGKRMQDTVTVFDDGRWQVLPVYFHVTGGGAWVDYNESKQGIVTPAHPYFWTNFRRTANKECLDCHATGVDVRYDRASRRWSTTFADAGVACESCHGPGARHAETKLAGDIVHPGEADDDVEIALCGACHGPREPLFPVLDAKNRFRPGDRYDDKYEALVIVDGRERSGEYFADGRPSSSSFEYQALLQSQCHRLGRATCLTCHTAPHKPHGANEIEGDVNASCVKCHRDVAAQGAAHTHHTSAAGASCVGCHMPRVVSGVLDKFADHTIDIPNAENTIHHNAPNACGVCHADKTNDAIATDIARWWPHAAQRQQRRVQLAEAIDEKTAAQSLPALTAIVRDTKEAPTLRGALALLLAQRFPRDAGAVLVPLLGDREAVVRSRVLEALGYTDAHAHADVVARLLNDASLQVRQNAALLLASLRDPRGEPALAKLAGDPATRGLFRPHVMLSVAAANRGDFDAATREIDTALSLAPYASDALVFRADIDARRGNLAAARAELEDALRFNPSHRGALARLRAAGWTR
ncbi:MAG TPA: ammonia-forming cytochrome c nitrite reductase subunit c552 [Thermoanaerobaculia bacterium]|nr:ammonia-forming cytochrome c nitrite reductase subunit c552 [Thermoanaerobaculia bacterium]